MNLQVDARLVQEHNRMAARKSGGAGPDTKTRLRTAIKHNSALQ